MASFPAVGNTVDLNISADIPILLVRLSLRLNGLIQILIPSPVGILLRPSAADSYTAQWLIRCVGAAVWMSHQEGAKTIQERAYTSPIWYQP